MNNNKGNILRNQVYRLKLSSSPMADIRGVGAREPTRHFLQRERLSRLEYGQSTMLCAMRACFIPALDASSQLINIALVLN